MSVMGRLRGSMQRTKEALLEHAYLITLGAVVAVIAASAMYTSSVRTRLEAQRDTPLEAAANAPEIALSPVPSPTRTPEVTPLPTIAPLVVSTLGTGAGRIWPVSGDIVRGHTPDKPVLWETLACYQAHPGVDIAGKAEEEVLCVMDGVVETITRDELWGYRVRIAQTDGSVADYVGLSLCMLGEGQAITRGQTVGTLMEAIPCEAELGAHLHLMYESGGQAADPGQLLRNAKRQ